MRLTGKVTLITNASTFMGPACAEEFAKEGAGLALALPGLPNYAAYSAGRAGVNGLTKVVGREVARHGIQVNAIAQNFVENPTYFGADLVADPVKLARVVKNVPAGRLARSEESARLAVFLASAEADFFCGQVVPFAGGWV